LEAFLFRDDPRKDERKTAELYHKKYSDTSGSYEDDSPRFWISNFVTKVGLRRAQQLLHGASEIDVSAVKNKGLRGAEERVGRISSSSDDDKRLNNKNVSLY
jgi:hypothetical protein